jgi:hypothetical protein
MSDEDDLVELPGGLDQLEAIAEEYAKREERRRFFVDAICLQSSHRSAITSQKASSNLDKNVPVPSYQYGLNL